MIFGVLFASISAKIKQIRTAVRSWLGISASSMQEGFCYLSNVLSETDIESDVESAFEELECIWPQGEGRTPHEGKAAGYVIGHGCTDGFLCKCHTDAYIADTRPTLRTTLQTRGWLQCVHCYRKFTDLDEFSRLVML